MLFCDCISPHPSKNIWLMISCHLDLALFIHSNEPLIPINISFCWVIGRTICYQALPLVICWMNSWWWFSSTRAWSPFRLTIKRLPLVSDSWFHMHVTLYLPSLKFYQNFIDWMQWNHGWIILLWSSCNQECCNILDIGLFALRVLLQWKHKVFTALLDLNKVVVNYWTLDVVTFL